MKMVVWVMWLVRGGEGEQASSPIFFWGERDGLEFPDSLNIAYRETVHGKLNLFSVPLGRIGKDFIKEQARLFLAFTEGSATEQIP